VSGRPAPPTSSLVAWWPGGLVAAVGAAAEVVLDQGVAEQPSLDRLGVAVQTAAGGQEHASRDIAGVAAVAAILAVQAALPGHGCCSSARTARSSS
jgi:hypothetical protein